MKRASNKCLSVTLFSCLVWEFDIGRQEGFCGLGACFLLLDIWHSSCISLRHGGSKDDLGRGTKQKMPLWRNSGDGKSCTDRLWLHIRIWGWGFLRHWVKKWETAEVQQSISAGILSWGSINNVDTDCQLLVSDSLLQYGRQEFTSLRHCFKLSTG